MRYPYNVKHGGVWYSAGEEVPEDTAPVVADEPREVVQENEIPKEPEPVRRRGGRPRTRKD